MGIYDRVLWLSTDMGNTVCNMYELENVVCSPTMRVNLFTTAAVDNINHNPSFTTAKHSFHGTSISLLQHKMSQNDRVFRNSIKWTTLPLAAEACYELLSCGYKKGCRKNCRCKRAKLECTGLCDC